MTWDEVNIIWVWVASSWANMGNPGPLDFPDTPEDQEIFGTFKWDTAENVWLFA